MKVVILWVAAIFIVNFLIAFILISVVDTTIAIQEVCVYSLILIILSPVMYLSMYYKLEKQSRNMTLQHLTEGRAQEMRILKRKARKAIIIIACIAFLCTLFFLYISLNLSVNDLQTLMMFFVAR